MIRKYLKLLYLTLAFIMLSLISPDLPSVYADDLDHTVIAGTKTFYCVNTKKELIKTFIKHITNLDTNFTIKVSHNAIKNNQANFNKLWKEFTKYPKYNEIMEHAKITSSVTYNYYNYFIWNISASYNISKNEAKKLLKKAKPIVKTEKELIKLMIKHAKKLDKDFYINVDKKVLNLENNQTYDAFWLKLYEIPEFNDISRYYKNLNSSKHTYNGYYKWMIKTKYSISKKELNYMNDFVKKWVEENIYEEMTDEEKVRTINDFMVENYYYTFGDKGRCSNPNNNCPEEKLGKYSVYSTFSLLYGGGGVCDAKAKLFYRLAKKAGLKVLYITGYVNGDTLHAWNMVKVDGNWYHIDNTWNRGTKPGMTEYEYYNTRDYYLKSDASMIKGHHRWLKGKYPRANFDYPLEEG